MCEYLVGCRGGKTHPELGLGCSASSSVKIAIAGTTVMLPVLESATASIKSALHWEEMTVWAARQIAAQSTL